MKQNESNADRIIRGLFALAVAVLYLTGIISGTIASVLGIIAVVLLVTSIVGMCPLYALFGISSRKKTPLAE